MAKAFDLKASVPQGRNVHVFADLASPIHVFTVHITRNRRPWRTHPALHRRLICHARNALRHPHTSFTTLDAHNRYQLRNSCTIYHDAFYDQSTREERRQDLFGYLRHEARVSRPSKSPFTPALRRSSNTSIFLLTSPELSDFESYSYNIFATPRNRLAGQPIVRLSHRIFRTVWTSTRPDPTAKAQYYDMQNQCRHRRC